jgi:DnaJ like chaperone protein
MAKFGKWIGAGIGAYAGGPIGAIIGFILGSAFDTTGKNAQRADFNDPYQRINATDPNGRQRQSTTGGYVISMMVLAAAVMKADGKTLKSELNYVRDFFERNFGRDSANEAVQMLHDILQQNIPIVDVCHQIQRNMDHPSRLQLLHFLFGIALADGTIHEAEIKTIAQIAVNLGVSSKDYESIKSMFIKNTDAAYKILEIESIATDEEVKKAYRKMAMKYHPDKVSYLGEDFQKSAHDKFQKVNEAYEEIRKQRGFA